MRTVIVFFLVVANALAAVAEAQSSMRVSRDGFFGCSSRDYFQKLVGFASQRDTAAFEQGLLAGFISGACVKLKAGEEVFVADTALLSGLIKVRPRGQVTEFWTVMEAVK